MAGVDINTLKQRQNENMNRANALRLSDASKALKVDEQQVVVKHINNDVLINELAYRLGILDAVKDNVIELASFLGREIQY